MNAGGDRRVEVLGCLRVAGARNHECRPGDEHEERAPTQVRVSGCARASEARGARPLGQSVANEREPESEARTAAADLVVDEGEHLLAVAIAPRGRVPA